MIALMLDLSFVFHMGIGKYCLLPMFLLQHSGSRSVNPGEAIYLENGMNISHWCKQYLGVTSIST